MGYHKLGTHPRTTMRGEAKIIIIDYKIIAAGLKKAGTVVPARSLYGSI